MTIYVALLRGINVGGKNIIKMAQLKSTFESLGLSRVKTYIQSGNVLFESLEDEKTLLKRIEREIEAAYGFYVPVILRTAEQLTKIAQRCPFSQEEISTAESSCDGESLYVSLLLDKPTQEGIQRWSGFKSDVESYVIDGREVYLLFYQSIRNSKLANQLHKLDVPSTTRNWKTINKLISLANEMETQS